MSEMEWLKIFGDNLAEMLVEYRLTQKDLAEMTGLSESTISNYIAKKRIPTLKAIINLSYALEVTVGELVDFGAMIE